MMIEAIAADTILSVFSGIYYHILCVEHGRQGKKLAGRPAERQSRQNR